MEDTEWDETMYTETFGEEVDYQLNEWEEMLEEDEMSGAEEAFLRGWAHA